MNRILDFNELAEVMEDFLCPPPPTSMTKMK